MFEKLQASLLYCQKCGRAMPVRERLLLILPTGELYDYLCQGCGSSVGLRTESGRSIVKGQERGKLRGIKPERD